MHNLPLPPSAVRSRAISRRDALRYTTALAGLGAASAACGMPTAAAAAPPRLIDFAAHQIPAQQIRAAGYSGVVNYVSLSRPGSSFGAKPITRRYADSLTAAGLVIVSNYQYGKPGGVSAVGLHAGLCRRRRGCAHRLAAAHRRGRRPRCAGLLHGR